MSAALPDRHVAVHAQSPAWAPIAHGWRVRPRRAPGSDPLGGLALARAYTTITYTYLRRIVPQIRDELAAWQVRAALIPDAALRRQAALALGKRGNMEGAALLATLAPAEHRQRAVRALVSFQAAYNYVDALSELPSDDPTTNGEQLHQALLVALYPDAPHPDYYAHNHAGEDGEYLNAIVEACRGALAGLPSFALIAPTMRAAAARIVDFQALNLSESQGGHEALRQWATTVTPAGSGLCWWETAAGAGSSLAVHALIAATASPDLARTRAQAIDEAYFAWVGSLHTLLDSLVDRAEDREHGQRSLLDYYPSQADAATRLALLAARSADSVRSLPNAAAHRVILVAMCAHYLSAPECSTSEAQAVTGALGRVIGRPLGVAIRVLRNWRRPRALTAVGGAL